MHSTNTKDMKTLFENWRSHNSETLKEAEDSTWGGARQWGPEDRMRMFGEAHIAGDVEVLVDATGDANDIFFGIGDDIWTLDADGAPSPRPFGDTPTNIMTPDEAKDYLRSLPDFDADSPHGRGILNTITEIEERGYNMLRFTGDEVRDMKPGIWERLSSKWSSQRARWSAAFTKLKKYWLIFVQCTNLTELIKENTEVF